MNALRRTVPHALLLLSLVVPSSLFAYKPWLHKVPAREHQRVNPILRSTDAAAVGHMLFEDHCAECHGADALGKGHHPSLRSARVQEQATPGDLHWLLRNGFLSRGMPSWSKLPDQQLWQIIAYVKSLEVSQTEASR
jgi:mono/diheme cytochrome c family protein